MTSISPPLCHPAHALSVGSRSLYYIYIYIYYCYYYYYYIYQHVCVYIYIYIMIIIIIIIIIITIFGVRTDALARCSEALYGQFS